MQQSEVIYLETQNLSEQVSKLKAGDRIRLSGNVYAIFDQAHKVFHDLLVEHKPLPLDLKGATVYYTSPSPTPKGKIVGSCGPTTSNRLDIYTPELIEAGVICMIGKGERSLKVYDAIKKHKAVYLVAAGGIGALLSRHVTEMEPVALLELGQESCVKIMKLHDFPLVVATDSEGNSIFEVERKKYRRL